MADDNTSSTDFQGAFVWHGAGFRLLCFPNGLTYRLSATELSDIKARDTFPMRYSETPEAMGAVLATGEAMVAAWNNAG